MTAEQLDLLADRDTQAILALVAADPCHARDVEAVVAAIRHVADDHGGRVDPNLVRARIPAWVFPNCVGATYGTLRRRGVLRRVEMNISDDRKGGNAGKPQWVYEWRGGAA